MNSRVALDVLNASSGLVNDFRLRRLLNGVSKLLRFLVSRTVLVEHLRQRHVTAQLHRGNCLSEPVTNVIREPENPRGVLQCLLRLDDVVRCDLGDVIRTVLFRHIAFDVISPLRRKVDVEVWHRLALWVEEALEQQTVFQRLEVGDPHRVSSNGASAGSTSGTDPNPVVACPPGEVSND